MTQTDAQPQSQPAAYHVPVLLRESIEGLAVSPSGTYVDVTFGGGGHSRAIAGCLTTGHLYAFDQDADAACNAPQTERFTFVNANFRYLENWMRYLGVSRIDGLLADLGVSSHHFDDARRGFSYRYDAPLDMRMNQHAPLTAADVLNGYSQERLADVLFLYGEFRNSRQIAAALVRRRASRPFTTTGDLKAVLEDMLGVEGAKRAMARAFQALRIEVNRELEALREMLVQAGGLLVPGGRLVVITYHSLEDRIVKNFMRTGNAEGHADKDFYGNVQSPLRPVGKPVRPSAEEVERNPRSRSATLRIAEKQ